MLCLCCYGLTTLVHSGTSLWGPLIFVMCLLCTFQSINTPIDFHLMTKCSFFQVPESTCHLYQQVFSFTLTCAHFLNGTWQRVNQGHLRLMLNLKCRACGCAFWVAVPLLKCHFDCTRSSNNENFNHLLEGMILESRPSQYGQTNASHMQLCFYM